MEEQIEFESNKSIEELKKETLNYFESQGFKLIKNNAGILQFERGSINRNMITFDPLKWKSAIKIEFGEGKVVGKFDINTIHQVVSLKEENLWKTFISNYQKTIETGESLIAKNQSELKATKNYSYKLFGYVMLGASLFAVLGGVLSYLTRIRSFVGYGAAIGAFLAYKYASDKENAANK